MGTGVVIDTTANTVKSVAPTNYAQTSADYDLTGSSFTVQIQAGPASNGAASVLKLYLDSNNWIDFYRSVSWGFIARYRSAGTLNESYTNVVGNFWRISHSSATNEIIWSVGSTRNGTYTEVRRNAATFDVSLLRVQLHTHDGSSTDTSTWGDFNVPT